MINDVKNATRNIFFYNFVNYCVWAIKQKYTIQIAHNLKGYGGLFILKYFYKMYNLVKAPQKLYYQVIKSYQ